MKAFVLALLAASFCATAVRAGDLGVPALGPSLGLPQLGHPSLMSEFGLPSSGTPAPTTHIAPPPAGGAAAARRSGYALPPTAYGAPAPTPMDPGSVAVPDTELGENALRLEGFKGVVPQPANSDQAPTPTQLERDALGGLEPADADPTATPGANPLLPAELGGDVAPQRPGVKPKGPDDKTDKDKDNELGVLGRRPARTASSADQGEMFQSPEPDLSSHIEWQYMKGALKTGLTAVLGFMGDY